MFCNSKYTTWYNDIIEKAKRQQRKKGEGIYYEKHHIVPKSMGGTNNKNNLVLLTAREHFMCHLLLPKMCIDSDHKRKMVYAYMCISEMGNKFNRHHIYKSKIYEAYKQKYVPLISGENCYMYGVSKSEEIKKKISETRIKEGTGRGENNPMYNKQHTTESKKRMSKTSKGLMTDRSARKAGIGGEVICYVS